MAISTHIGVALVARRQPDQIALSRPPDVTQGSVAAVVVTQPHTAARVQPCRAPKEGGQQGFDCRPRGLAGRIVVVVKFMRADMGIQSHAWVFYFCAATFSRKLHRTDPDVVSSVCSRRVQPAEEDPLWGRCCAAGALVPG